MRNGKLYVALWETYTHRWGNHAYEILDEARADFPDLEFGHAWYIENGDKVVEWFKKWFGSQLGENNEKNE